MYSLRESLCVCVLKSKEDVGECEGVRGGGGGLVCST